MLSDKNNIKCLFLFNSVIASFLFTIFTIKRIKINFK